METTAKASQQYKVMPIMISLLLAGFIGMFSETALNIALTDLMKELNITAATVQWLTTGYLLVLGILVPVSGLLLQWFTTRQLFTVSLIFSIIGTLIAALAPSFPFLLAARIVQALGTGLLLPLMFNTILVIFPPHKRGAAMERSGLSLCSRPPSARLSQDWFWSISTGTGFSGSLFHSLCWRLCSVSHICRMYLKRQSRKSMYCLSSCRRLASAALCSDSATRVKAPGMVQPDCYRVADCRRCRPYPIFNPPADNEAADDEPPCVQIPDVYFGVIMVFICMMVILSSMLLLPMYLQGGLVLTAFASGLVLLPGGILNGFMSPVTGRLFDKYGPKWLVIPGFVIVTVVLWFFSNVTTTSTAVLIIILHTCLMIGISMIMMPAQTNGLNQLPREFYPDGTAIMNTLQQMAGAIGTAVAVSIMAAGQHDYMSTVKNPADPAVIPQALTAGVQHAFVFAMIVAIIGLIGAFFMKRVKVDH